MMGVESYFGLDYNCDMDAASLHPKVMSKSPERKQINFMQQTDEPDNLPEEKYEIEDCAVENNAEPLDYDFILEYTAYKHHDSDVRNQPKHDHEGLNDVFDAISKVEASGSSNPCLKPQMVCSQIERGVSPDLHTADVFVEITTPDVYHYEAPHGNPIAAEYMDDFTNAPEVPCKRETVTQLVDPSYSDNYIDYVDDANIGTGAESSGFMERPTSDIYGVVRRTHTPYDISGGDIVWRDKTELVSTKLAKNIDVGGIIERDRRAPPIPDPPSYVDSCRNTIDMCCSSDSVESSSTIYSDRRRGAFSWPLTNDMKINKRCSDQSSNQPSDGSTTIAASVASSTITKRRRSATTQKATAAGVFVCPHENCERSYTKKSHLKVHLRTHCGLRPHACDWPNCGWRFTRSDELKRHRRKHTGARPFVCQTCGRSYARSDHLHIHKKKHVD